MLLYQERKRAVRAHQVIHAILMVLMNQRFALQVCIVLQQIQLHVNFALLEHIILLQVQ